MSAAMRYAIGVLLAVLIGAGCNLDGPDETTTDALVQEDKTDAIKAARRSADPRITAMYGESP